MRNAWGAPALLAATVLMVGVGCGSSGGGGGTQAGSGGDGNAGSGGSGGSSTPAEPKGWVKWQVARGGNDHWYGIHRTKGDWQSAQAAAQALSTKAYLVTITTDSEEQFLTSTFLTGADKLRVFWIGGTTPTHDRLFTWITGEPFSYTHWKSGEPNNWTGDEYYLCINWNAVRGPIGDWNDVALTGTKGFDGGANDGPYEAIFESETLPTSM